MGNIFSWFTQSTQMIEEDIASTALAADTTTAGVSVTTMKIVDNSESAKVSVTGAGGKPVTASLNTDMPILSAESDYMEILTDQFAYLLHELQPRLFLDGLKHKISPDVVNLVKRQNTDVDQVYELLTNLKKGNSTAWYKAFLLAIAGLYPDIFKQLTGQEPTRNESLIYIAPLSKGLRESMNNEDSSMEHQYVHLNLLRHHNRTTQEPYRASQNELFLALVYSGYFHRGIPPSRPVAAGVKTLTEADLLPDDCGSLMLLYGAAGVGKSTLVKYLMRQWKQGLWGDQYDLVFTLNLRKLVLHKECVELASLLQDYAEFPVECGIPNEGVTKWLCNNAGKVLFFLDGLDELNNFKNQFQSVPHCGKNVHTKMTPLHWAINLLKRKILQNSCIVLTSRPFPQLSHLEINRYVEIRGLSEEGVKEFIQLNVNASEKQKVLDTIYNNPFLRSLCTNTFYCVMLCKMFSEVSEEQALALTTYTRINEYIISYLAASVDPDALPMLLPHHLKECLPCLEELAYKGIPNGPQGWMKLVFDENDLKAVRLDDKDLQNAVRSGLLLVHQRKGKLKLHVEFIHRSVQDLLAMKRLLRSPARELQDFLSRQTEYIGMDMYFLFGLGLDTHLSQHLGFEITPWNIEILLRFARHKQVIGRTGFTQQNTDLANLIHESQRIDLAKELGDFVLDDGDLPIGPSIMDDPGSGMTVVDMAAFRFVLKFSKQLNSINVFNVTLEEARSKQLALIIQDAEHLQQVQLHRVRMTEKAFIVLMESMAVNKSIEHLTIANVNTCEDISNFRLPSTKRPVLTDKCLQSLLDTITTCTSFNHLLIEGPTFDDQGMKHLAKAASHLQGLCLSLDEVSLQGCHFLSHGIAVSNFSLRGLGLYFKTLPSSFMECLSEGIKKNGNLTELTLCGMSDESYCALVSISDTIRQLCYLTNLVFMRMKFNKGWEHLANAISQNTSLTSLKLIDMNIDIVALSHGIKGSSSLSHLTMWPHTISHSSWISLTDAIRHSPSLTYLEVNLCYSLIDGKSTPVAIEDEDILLLCEAVQSSACLRKLHLSGVSKMSDEAWGEFRALGPFMKELRVCGKDMKL